MFNNKDSKSKVYENAYTALLYAAKHGFNKTIQRLYNEGVDVRLYDNGALLTASNYGNAETVSLLLSLGDFNKVRDEDLLESCGLQSLSLGHEETYNVFRDFLTSDKASEIGRAAFDMFSPVDYASLTVLEIDFLIRTSLDTLKKVYCSPEGTNRETKLKDIEKIKCKLLGMREWETDKLKGKES